MKKLATLGDTFDFLKRLHADTPDTHWMRHILIDDMLTLIENDEFPAPIDGDYMPTVIAHLGSVACWVSINDYVVTSIEELTADIVAKD